MVDWNSVWDVCIAGHTHIHMETATRWLPAVHTHTPLPYIAAGENHHKHKVQMSGPASVQVRVGCSNNMQLQPPPTTTSSGSAPVLVDCTMQQSLQLVKGQGSAASLHV